jgi:hypothetical protein
MTFKEIREEVQDRGYQYVTTARVDKWVRQAYIWVCSQQPWPFLEAEETGASPLTIADLSQVLYVTDTDNNVALHGLDLRDIRDKDPGLTSTGNPVNWYLKNNEVNVWPASAGNIWVRYIQKPAVLAENAEPLVPEEYQEVIVDGAVLRGLKDNDEYDTAAALQTVIDGQVGIMVDALLSRNYMNPQNIVQSGGADDYIA